MFHDIKICFLHLMNSKFRLILDWKATNVSLENIVDTDEMPSSVSALFAKEKAVFKDRWKFSKFTIDHGSGSAVAQW